MSKGGQRYLCPAWHQTFYEGFDSLYYRVVMSVQNKYDKSCKQYREGCSLRGISLTTRLAYNPVVSIVRSASQKAQLVHNAVVQAVRTQEVSLDELWSFALKNKNSVSLKNQRLETAGLNLSTNRQHHRILVAVVLFHC